MDSEGREGKGGKILASDIDVRKEGEKGNGLTGVSVGSTGDTESSSAKDRRGECGTSGELGV